MLLKSQIRVIVSVNLSRIFSIGRLNIKVKRNLVSNDYLRSQTEFITGEWGMDTWAEGKREWVIGNITSSSADIWWFFLQENTPRNFQSETVKYQSGFKVGFLKKYVLNLFTVPPSVRLHIRVVWYIRLLLLSVWFLAFWRSHFTEQPKSMKV